MNQFKNINPTLKIFKQLELQGAPLNQELLYSFFFYDSKKNNLIALSSKLESIGFQIIKIEKSSSDYFTLHISKKAILNGEKIIELGKVFLSLCKENSVEIYDGWDVGKIDNSELVSSKIFENFVATKRSSDLFKLGIQLYDLELYENAIIVFRLCTDRSLNKSESLYKMGNCLANLNRVNESIKTLKKVLLIAPTHESALFNIATNYYRLEDDINSVLYHQKVIALNNKHDRAYYGLAASLYVLGKMKDAQKACQEALNINPKNERVLKLLEKL
jgi:tetratricopeptide (TPR) repeat protein